MIKLTLFLIVFLLVLMGCGRDSKNQGDSKPGSMSGEVKVINEKELKDIINRRNGKTLVLNIWATWCEPCVEEFPAIVQIDKNYNDKGVEVIALSVDLPADRENKILPFLEKQGVKFKVFVADEKNSDKIINMLNADWGGAIPATFVFDKQGKQQRFILGAHTYEQMVSIVDSVKTL